MSTPETISPDLSTMSRADYEQQVIAAQGNDTGIVDNLQTIGRGFPPPMPVENRANICPVGIHLLEPEQKPVAGLSNDFHKYYDPEIGALQNEVSFEDSPKKSATTDFQLDLV